MLKSDRLLRYGESHLETPRWVYRLRLVLCAGLQRDADGAFGIRIGSARKTTPDSAIKNPLFLDGL